jgi:3'-phosphoadenosine 5'-phosphosulfate sulfotransferase (PAPS reductase)/FAD synthetase
MLDLSKIGDRIPVVSVSGGKDSTAMCLALMEAGLSKDQFLRVFADTGWESPETYDYLDRLENIIGKIDRVKGSFGGNHENLFFDMCISQKAIPNGMMRFCTRFLKMDPIGDYLKNLEHEPINIVGIRAEESPRRAKMPEWEYSDRYDCEVWRPIINWKIDDIISIHRRFGIEPNPLYLDGFERVGCYPCVFANKKDLRLLSKDEDRVKMIERLEAKISDITGKKVTFYKMPIRKMIEWSQTARGGKQLMLLDTDPPACMRWGLCSTKK